MAAPPSRPPGSRRRSTPFRPRFTIMILYVGAFYFLFALLLVLPALLDALAQLPPGGETPTPEELELARDVSRGALSGGKVYVALFAALAATALGAWRGLLPGLRAPS